MSQGDVLDIGSQMRPKTYALIQQKPKPVIPRELVVEVRERTDAFGGIVERLTPEEMKRVVARVTEAKPEAVAISLVFSFLNHGHEAMLAEAADRAGAESVAMLTRVAAAAPPQDALRSMIAFLSLE